MLKRSSLMMMGMGALVMDDGSVMMLQQWLTKQLWKGGNGELHVKDLSDPKKPFLLPWTVQLQKYAKKDVKLVVGAREVDFQAHLRHVRRGAGCSILWRSLLLHSTECAGLWL